MSQPLSRSMISRFSRLLWFTLCSLPSLVAATDQPGVPTLEAITSPAQARDALAASNLARQRIDANWRRENYNCYQRFAVNPCVARINGERRKEESQLKVVEIHARKVIRETQITERNRAEAQASNATVARPPSPAAGLPQQSQREAENQARMDERARSEKTRQAQAKLDQERQQERTQQMAQRQAERSAKLAQVPQQAAKYQQRLREHKLRLEQHKADRARKSDSQREAENKRASDLSKK